jgi:GGDEF domain-containing protein
VLKLPRFLDESHRVDHPGTLLVIFLATFEPIGRNLGIPAVIRSAEYLTQLIHDLAPRGAFVGELTEITTGVFLPNSGLDEAASFMTSLREATFKEDLFISPEDFGKFYDGDGKWAEIRVAAGAITVPSGTFDRRQLLEEARRHAEEDLRRYPEEWKYPITIFDD